MKGQKDEVYHNLPTHELMQPYPSLQAHLCIQFILTLSINVLSFSKFSDPCEKSCILVQSFQNKMSFWFDS